jgi:hypothetical protein
MERVTHEQVGNGERPLEGAPDRTFSTSNYDTAKVPRCPVASAQGSSQRVAIFPASSSTTRKNRATISFC